MTPQRRTALVSIGAAAVLAALKLGAGLISGSLGLISEALHSGTDLVAALLTFFAIGVSGRPADEGHQYGHGKAEHLAALAEATVLALVSVAVAALAVTRLTGTTSHEVDTAWWVFVVVAVVLVIDLSRTVVSLRTARRYGSEALRSNAIHFGSDFAGTLAVLAGLVAAAAGYPGGDSIAALFVAALVLVAAGRLIRRNVDVLMDRAPADAEAAARAAIAGIEPPVSALRLRLRQAAGRTFADVVISVSPGAAVGQGHAVADLVEAELEAALPGSDVVVHVEPRADEAALRERALAAALTVPRVREIHNLSIVVAQRRDRALAPPEAARRPPARGGARDRGGGRARDRRVRSRDRLGADPPRAARGGRAPASSSRRPRSRPRSSALPAAPCASCGCCRTEKGVVAFLTLGLDPASTLAEAHARASEVEERLRRARPDVADVIVHTEP